MSQLARFERSLKRAQGAVSGLVATADATEQQARWEEFLIWWRTAFNQMSDFCHLSGQEAIAEAAHAKRKADDALNYVWEARNAEEHASAGSGDPHASSVTSQVTYNGEPVTHMGEAVVVTLMQTKLRLRPVNIGKSSKTISPPDLTVQELARRALDFLIDVKTPVVW